MTHPAALRSSPWDSAVLGVQAYEITDPSREMLAEAARVPGHYTVRWNPLESKQPLHDYGFYYCDTLIEPYCVAKDFSAYDDVAVTISEQISLDALLDICHGAFGYGRFHRDFSVSRRNADMRYDNWLAQLYAEGMVYGLLYAGELVGFIAVQRNRLVLHAIAQSHRGRGFAKSLWSPVCRAVFDRGYDELVSSVSAANLAAVNLYASLGFRFRNPVDLYHRLTR